MNDIAERDWKYLARIKGELLNALCARLNAMALVILSDSSLSQHERFLRLYRHLLESDQTVADCFNDWRRSNILDKLLMLRRHQLLMDEHMSRLSAHTQERLGLR